MQYSGSVRTGNRGQRSGINCQTMTELRTRPNRRIFGQEEMSEVSRLIGFSPPVNSGMEEVPPVD